LSRYAFEELYVSTFNYLADAWVTNNHKYMEFKAVAQGVEDKILQTLGKIHEPCSIRNFIRLLED